MRGVRDGWYISMAREGIKCWGGEEAWGTWAGVEAWGTKYHIMILVVILYQYIANGMHVNITASFHLDFPWICSSHKQFSAIRDLTSAHLRNVLRDVKQN